MLTEWEGSILDYFFENGNFKGELEDLVTDIFTKYADSLHSRNKHFGFNNRLEVRDTIKNSIQHLLKLFIIYQEEGVFKVKKQTLDKVGQIKSEIYYKQLKEINSD
jgi:hypothetical protein